MILALGARGLGFDSRTGPWINIFSKYFTSRNSKYFLVFFITIFLDAKNWAIERKKKRKDRKRKRCVILTRKRGRASNCEIFPLTYLPCTIKSLLWKCSNKYQLSVKCLFLMSKEIFYAQRKKKEKHKFGCFGLCVVNIKVENWNF